MNNEYLDLIRDNPELFKNSDDESSITVVTDPDLMRDIEKEYDTDIGIIYSDRYIMLLKDLS